MKSHENAINNIFKNLSLACRQSKMVDIYSAKRLEVRKQGGVKRRKTQSLIFQHFLQKYECVHLHTSALFHNCKRFTNVHHACIYSPEVQCCACNASDALKQSSLLQQCKMLKFPAVKMPFPPHTKTRWPTTSRFHMHHLTKPKWCFAPTIQH